jgi:hypothetical protein
MLPQEPLIIGYFNLNLMTFHLYSAVGGNEKFHNFHPVAPTINICLV